jgi:hypothetical protein
MVKQMDGQTSGRVERVRKEELAGEMREERGPHLALVLCKL